jgi:hypothetical protein
MCVCPCTLQILGTEEGEQRRQNPTVRGLLRWIGPGTGQQGGELVRHERAAEVEPLPLFAALRLQKRELFRRFHAFSNDPLIETPPHADDSLDDG